MLVWWSTEDAQLVFRWVKLCVKLSFVDSGCVWWRAGMAYCKILRASPAAVLDSRFAFDSIQILSQIAFWFALYPLASLWRLQNCVPIKIIDHHHQQGKSNQISQPQSREESDQSDTPRNQISQQGKSKKGLCLETLSPLFSRVAPPFSLIP